jgi:hypothetical protein
VVVQNLSYEGTALRDNEPYLVTVFYENNIQHTLLFRTLSEAIWCTPSRSYTVELAKVEEAAEGVPVRVPLAMFVAGAWIIDNQQKELTMAKVKEAMNGGGRDVESDLLGVSKPRGKKAAEIAAKGGKVARGAKVAPKESAPRRARVLFEDHQRLKKIGDRNTRPESNVGRVISLLKPNMTFGEFAKALEKSKIPFKPAGILSFLVKDGVVQVR